MQRHFILSLCPPEADYVGNGHRGGTSENGQLTRAVPVLQGLAVALIRVRFRTCVMFGSAGFQYGLPSASLG